ncbi:Ebp2-domain-containing protein [Karstenula rhodostoma CBS 690.94]|uniref:Ebp2-domain-containing protein n=1 Tax=Karstenula rhodostoma CBS 690.94 TaxID=1392251 RepID=A0A9P4P6L8_9PLEO|nr:Ebp2-domain-containing protein [Karstenula rhodostoma CBS 690.94]
MARSKLKSALNNEKGRNFKLERQRRQEKEARKRKEQNKPEGDDESEAEGGVALEEEVKVAPKSNGKAKKEKANGVKATAPAKEAEWETDDSEDEDASDDEEAVPFDLSRLEDSESDVSGDDEEDEEVGETLGAGGEDEDEEDVEDEDEDEDGIAFSDIESLADEDKADIVPYQRLTINNTAALTAALNRIKLPYSKLGFSEHMSLTTDEDVEIADVDDDLNRELAFYKQSLSAVKDARGLLKKEGAPFSRPADYFAEMVKDDEHMGKIKAKLMDEAAGKKASAEARKQRDLKKFGKQVQVAKLQERAKEKRDTLDKISQLKRKRSGADVTATNEEDLFDVALDKSEKPERGRGGEGGNFKRQKKNDKFGFGGKKRYAKSNDAQSSADGKGFSHKKMKGGAAKRPGKARRMNKK